MWIPLQAVLVKFKKSLFKKEVPVFFPEEELRAERRMGDDDEEEFNRLDQMVMGKSIEDFRDLRQSKVGLDGLLSPVQRTSQTNISTTPSVAAGGTTSPAGSGTTTPKDANDAKSNAPG